MDLIDPMYTMYTHTMHVLYFIFTFIYILQSTS